MRSCCKAPLHPAEARQAGAEGGKSRKREYRLAGSLYASCKDQDVTGGFRFKASMTTGTADHSPNVPGLVVQESSCEHSGFLMNPGPDLARLLTVSPLIVTIERMSALIM